MYLDNNNITLNDLCMKNCDFGNMLSNLDTAGTVVEVNGDNIIIKNSRFSNGKTVLRSFSSNNLLIENSLLSNSRNFLISTGSNEYVKVNENQEFEFVNIDGTVINSNINNYLQTGLTGDSILNSYLTGGFNSSARMKSSLLSMQEAFNNEDVIKDIYKGSMTIKDTYFYRSGIASIALETMFNGPFLQYGTPSMISQLLGMLQTQDGKPLNNFKATNIAAVSYPVTVNITGDTRFYDYKDINNVDIEGLINENITEFAGSVNPSYSGEINIDKIFPIKTYLLDAARKNNCIYTADGESYINIPIAYYGGGLNLSKVNFIESDYESNIGRKLEIDLLDSYLNLQSSDNVITELRNMMVKAVTVVSGYEPFYFECAKGNGYLYGETPKVSDLIDNAKGE